MFKTLLSVCVWTSLAWSSCQATDYFSSISGLEHLLNTEHILLQDLSAQVKASRTLLQQLELELSSIELEHASAAGDTDNYLTNPINVYRLMKRLHTDWFNFEQRAHIVNSQLHFNITQYHDLHFPSQEDVDGAALALVRLQSTYKLDVAQVAAGILNGIKYGTDMSWQDCFVLGQQLFELEDYNNTKVWLRESMERLQRLHPQKQTTAAPPPEPTILNSMEMVAKSLFQMGDFDTAYELSQRVLELDPARKRNWQPGSKVDWPAAAQSGRTETTETSTQLWVEQPKQPADYQLSEEFAHYEKVCRGEVQPTPAKQRQLRCRYSRGTQAFGLLAPHKLEEYSLEPLVLSYHDMLPASSLAQLRQMATPHMKRSTVNSVPGAGQRQKSAFRVSKNAWLPYSTHPLMQRMLRDVGAASGLDMTYCEQLQVANYGVGGHYEPHWDFFRNAQHYPPEEGNRMATAIFYLSEVEQGGATAFPFLDFAVRPQQGSVLFWYNLHRSSDMDFRTKHAGCPVLKGSKWIANIWIHEATQTFARPCDLYRDNEISLEYQTIK
ncbi:prolyl 4-hydroxylase subunit alpha-2 isoform X1 [Drosophila busckii]|uniref:prolyl 4-hydroxylase subunit alpha-2 isoform X1 n=2 Tax=Drosophila busckii TaxID=30019 RepID=UPI00083F416C|nr:prolyl 4-hydroxylase subunit alpha-2 isoform X1 [Drosophila busckii]